MDAPRDFLIFCFIIFIFSPNEQRAGGGVRCQTFSFSFFPCSADHERDWPPCKVVFFGLATNALNVRNNNNNVPCTSCTYFCTMCGLEKLGFVDQKWLNRNLSALLLRTLHTWAFCYLRTPLQSHLADTLWSLQDESQDVRWVLYCLHNFWISCGVFLCKLRKYVVRN